MVDTSKDKALAQLVSIATICAGDTVQLPQRINIGPDRIIDQFHFVIATAIYKAGGPVCSSGNIVAYGKGATDVMNAYIATKLSEGDDGLVKCAGCYLQAYASKVLEEIYLSIGRQIASECEALRLKAGDYVV